MVTETRSYNAANQVVGWQYDAAGNLVNDGTTTSTYDALNRLLTSTSAGQSRTNSYNGDGVLVAQTANGTTTRYTQDLAAPLSQVLQTAQGSTTTDYLYGLERLASVSGGTRTWYGTDALGSVRVTMNDAIRAIAFSSCAYHAGSWLDEKSSKVSIGQGVYVSPP